MVLEEVQEFLSARSFGPLLTLLEEPRKHVHFFLLSMDISIVPQAIQDRCSHYRFVPVSVPDIVVYLHRVLEKAGLVSIVPDYFIAEGLSALAENANGSVRKAVQGLEMCIQGEVYSTNSIEKILG